MSETLEPALPKELDEKAERVMRRLCDRKLCVVTAESCTGGLLASLLTDIEGCGRGFERGFVTYSGEAKKELLGLSSDKVEENEAVNADVARDMAEGALKRSNADVALSVTGFAGPGGPDDEEGLVFMACSRRDGSTRIEERHYGAIGRGAVRIEALRTLLDMLDDAF
jgi:nicotinamide-nucleotide amidase